MQEKTKVIIYTIIIILIGIFFYFISQSYGKFNFYKSELTINENIVTEKLTYFPDKNYHTLYRTFESQIIENDIKGSDTVYIQEVKCTQGNPYFQTKKGICFNNNSEKNSRCIIYTEPNEYGCTFGNEYGFFKNQEYVISSNIKINSKKIFNIKGKNYIKFIAYGRYSHKNLKLNKNLFITGDAIFKEKYSFDEYVIIYVQYTGNVTDLEVINKNNFEFDDKQLFHFFSFFLSMSPGLIFFLIWFLFGRERSDPNIPEKLSTYPNERKAWEIASFFNPPFTSDNKNIFPTLLTDLYYRKIIDIRINNKIPLVKILNKKNLDSVEKKFIEFIERLEKEKEYFKLSFKEITYKKRIELNKKYYEFTEEIDSEKKTYFENTLKTSSLIILAGIISTGISSLLENEIIAIFTLISTIIMGNFVQFSPILTKYKENYYEEHKKWQAFKKFLSESDSIKLHGHKGTIIWGKYLVYATALDEAKKIIKDLKNKGIISEDQYNTYSLICSSRNLTLYTGGIGGTSSSGGFSRVGSGGVGGGGGGGR